MDEFCLTPATPDNASDVSALLPKKKLRTIKKKRSAVKASPQPRLKFNSEVMCNSLIQYSESKGLTKDDLKKSGIEFNRPKMKRDAKNVLSF